MIEICDVYKRFGDKEAVKGISFHVDEGEIMGFLGPNGAGKTTTLNILTGYLSATSGTCRIDGVDILEHPVEAKKLIGFLPEQSVLLRWPCSQPVVQEHCIHLGVCTRNYLICTQCRSAAHMPMIFG